MNNHNRSISIRFVRGYWTVYSGEQAIVSCASYERAAEFGHTTEAEHQQTGH